jgi:hypothetical protein
MAATNLSPEQILAWVNLGTALVKTGVDAGKKLVQILHLAHGPVDDAQVSEILKGISARATADAAAALADAGIVQETEGSGL